MPVRQDQTSTIRPCRGPSEFPALREIWRSSVRATHDFLDDADFARIDADLVPTYLPAVTLIVLERGGAPQGFAGISPGTLEMLFVAAVARGSGVGTALLSEATSQYGVTRVDVNEQNLGALNFYLGQGFVRSGRSEVDGDGRPYPILHLSKDPKPGSASLAE
ncbi:MULTISPECIES: GNAT family N-acetyltransferase [unclassified Leucobacter]|uniref:GNAT family N-acetyltransferase n=1 Tax=unclassified Leucobacter TaxID=2621730 RepID=UPI00165D609D|nr:MULTISPECIES: GNAT family N-acetyltransferase [unclassified Leucobacter]MBC9935412.1 GNAT family N-acetyltransferase [Leucobacter sp. cx-87]